MNSKKSKSPFWGGIGEVAQFLLPAIVALAVVSTACGEDRTHEYEERTGLDHWMMDVMREEYLWGDVLKDLTWKDYFAKPDEFMAKITAQAPVDDEWSWCAIDTLPKDSRQRGLFNHLDSYGLDLVVMTDPTGETSRQYGRVMTVAEGSPAARCGLKRGDFISTLDGTKMNAAVAKDLVSGKQRRLTVERLTWNAESEALEWGASETVEMDASEYVEDKAFPVCKTFTTDAGKVGYLMCNRLTEGAVERDAAGTEYRDDLTAKMASMAGTEFAAFVLDLRLCNDGTLDMACRMASYFVGSDKSGETFAKVIYSERKKALNHDVPFNADAAENGVKTHHLYVITSSYTQGAAEWLIRGIRKAMGDDFVTVVGLGTNGQNVMTAAYPSEHLVTLHPVVAYVADADGDYDYADGITPDVEVDEKSVLYLFPYGDEQEALLQSIFTHEE